MRNFALLLSLITVTSCFAQTPQLKLELIASGFSKPVDIKHAGDNRLFVVERQGAIKILRPNGTVDATPFMNIANKVNSVGGEQGLLSLAFSPTYKQDGFFFVNYIRGAGAGTSVIARYKVHPLDSNLADTASETILFQLPQPFDNHNGCDLRFGPDGYLYASFGDGGSANDPNGNGQNLGTLLGKIIRINPFQGATYTVPSSNPFVNTIGALPEIWAYGLRNPWRCSFDRITGDYWIADVGQNVIEEVNCQPAASSGGLNYGWRCYEGSAPFNTVGCTNSGYEAPVFEYTHTSPNGCSITGGYVYRGAKYQNMFGNYFFTDFCSGRIWCTTKTGSTYSTTVLNNYFQFQFSSFGEDQAGELYLASHGSGNIHRIKDTSSCNPVAFLGLTDSLQLCGAVKLQALVSNDNAYAWLHNGTSVPNATTAAFTATQSGWHKVVVTASGSCTAADSVYVTVLPAVTLSLGGLNTTYCLESPIDTIVVNPIGGTLTVNGSLAGNLFYPAALGVGVFTVKQQLLNANGCVSESVITVTISSCAGISSSASRFEGCRLVPNPANESTELTFYSHEAKPIQLVVRDVKGQLVAHYNFNVALGEQALQIPTSQLSAGVYVISIEESVVNLKLVVTH